MGGWVIVAEKPSVARAISWALKDHPGVVVSSVRGHVYEVDLPSEFRRWSTFNLSSILDIRRLRAFVSDRRSYTTVKGALTQNAGKTLVVATDNDSEGDLIGREILNIYRSVRGASAPYARMRFNSTSPQDILSAWQNLEDGLNERWVEKAQFRQAFDLLIGAAFTRLLTLGIQSKQVRHMTSFGSCQTPTLYFVVKREEEITNFKPEKFWTLKALLETNKGERFEASTDRIFVPAEAKKMYDKVKSAKDGSVEGYSEEAKTLPRPYPLRTDDALRDLTRITGISASSLLSMMEQLYSSGYISYPRTDTNKYSPSFTFSQSRKAAEDAGILKGLTELSGTANPRNGNLDDGAHPPIYPLRPFTEQKVGGKIWEYVARRFIANAFMDDAQQLSQHAEAGIETVSFFAYGSFLTSTGFFQVYPYFRPTDKKMPKLVREEKLRVVRMNLVEDATKPPPRLTEADLLRLMEKNGIGTDCLAPNVKILVKQNPRAAEVLIADLFTETIGYNGDVQLSSTQQSVLSLAPSGTVSQTPFLVSRRPLRQGERMIHVTFEDGFSIDVTENHLFLVSSRERLDYKPAKELNKGCRCAALDPKGNTTSTFTIQWETFLRKCNKRSKLFASTAINDWRIKNGVSQKQLAKRLDVYPADVSYWERRKKVPLWVLRELSLPRPDSLIGVSGPFRNPFPLVLDSRIARLLAHLLGDGGLEKSRIERENVYKYAYYNTNIQLMKQFREDVRILFGVALKIRVDLRSKEQWSTRYYERIPAPIGRVFFMINEILSGYGLLGLLPAELFPDFVGAIFDDEGHAHKDKAALFISNTNPAIVAQVTTMLTTLGFSPFVSKYVDPRSKRYKTQCKIHMYGYTQLSRFIKLVPVASERKLTQLYRWISTCARFSVRKQILQLCMTQKRTTEELRQELDLSATVVRKHLRGLRKEGLIAQFFIGNNVHRVRSLVYLSKPYYDTVYGLSNETPLKRGLVTKTVLSVEEAPGSEFVYDLSCTPNAPNFSLANGVIVHNSTRASFPTIIANRGYAIKIGKYYKPTPLGVALIEALAETDERLVTPDTRKLVEDKMRMIEKGTVKYGDALNESTSTYKQLLQECQSRIDSVSEKLAKAATAPAIERNSVGQQAGH